MLIYLDSRTNHKRAPNENFARELMELFSLGIGNYTEDDVRNQPVPLPAGVWTGASSVSGHSGTTTVSRAS